MPKIATAQRRLGAKAVDLFLVIFVGLLIPRGIGALIAFAYSIVGDSIHVGNWRAQSIGKKIFGLQVVDQETHNPIGIKKSLIRNAPVGIVTFFAVFPLWGWALAILIGIPLFLIEAVLVFRAENRQRLGDVMADTEVMDLR